MKRTYPYPMLFFIALLLLLALPAAASAPTPDAVALPLTGEWVNGRAAIPGRTWDMGNFLLSVQEPSQVTVTVIIGGGRSVSMTLNQRSFLPSYPKWVRVGEEYRTQFSVYLNPGEHKLDLFCHSAENYDAPFRLSALARSASLYDEMEPNDKTYQAQELSLDVKVRGLLAIQDTDYYTFTLDAPSEVEMTVTQYERPIRFLLSTAGDLSEKMPNAKRPVVTEKRRVTLRAGNHLLHVTRRLEPDHDLTGYYAVAARVVGKAKPDLRVDFPKRTYVGNRTLYDLRAKPYDIDWPEVAFSSSRPDVAYWDDCELVAKKPGKTRVTLRCGDASVSYAITVVPNQYALSRPRLPKNLQKRRTVLLAHKSIRYVDGKLLCETFVINRSRYPVYAVTDIWGNVYGYNNREQHSTPVPDWRPRRPLMPGKTAVIRYEISEPYQMTDLRKGAYKALIYAIADFGGRERPLTLYAFHPNDPGYIPIP